MSQVHSVEEHKLVSSFESVRRTLMQEKYRDRLDRPLAYWALPNDRRLPLAFLGRSLNDLLQTPFEDLSATRGIGQKKIGSLVKLLNRAVSDSPPAIPYGLVELSEELDREMAAKQPTVGSDQFNPTVVSEALWVRWCETVQRFHLGREILGRLAPSLQSLPTVIWHTPLSTYLGKSVAEIRNLKTHGEKRVRVVLEVFHSVHTMLNGAHQGDHLSLHLVPGFVPAVDEYLARLTREDHQATRDEVSRHLVEPLLAQTLIDSGETVHALARDRLGIGVPAKSVRDQAQEMGVTRARVYQLLEDCSKIMRVRWPEGRHYIRQVPKNRDPAVNQLMKMTRQLFFPEKEETFEDHSPELTA